MWFRDRKRAFLFLNKYFKFQDERRVNKSERKLYSLLLPDLLHLVCSYPRRQASGLWSLGASRGPEPSPWSQSGDSGPNEMTWPGRLGRYHTHFLDGILYLLGKRDTETPALVLGADDGLFLVHKAALHIIKIIPGTTPFIFNIFNEQYQLFNAWQHYTLRCVTNIITKAISRITKRTRTNIFLCRYLKIMIYY